MRRGKTRTLDAMHMRGAVLGPFVIKASTAVFAEKKMDDLIQKAAADGDSVPALIKRLLSQHVYIIASWDNPQSRSIRIQDFVRNGRPFIPVFSDEAHFKAETKGSDFESKGVSIDGNLFASLLRGDELVVLNPGSHTPIDLNAQEMKAFVVQDRPPK